MRIWALLLSCTLLLVNAEARGFRAGAARIDITPAASSALPMAGYPGRDDGHTGIHDNLFVRALVVDDGVNQAGIVACDLIGFSMAMRARVAARASRETGLPEDHILLVATHNHGGPALANPGDSNRARAEYTERVEQSIVDALQQAKRALQPARAGAGNGRMDLNMNRRARIHDGSWWLGFNPEGPSDKTVAVVKFESASGQPIAILANYAVHGTSMGQENRQITADAPGATSRFVEQHYKEAAVVLWTSGAAGDQCPLYDRSPARFSGVLTMGRLLGEEVIRVAESIRTSDNVPLRAEQKVISCPGQRLVPESRQTKQYRFTDANPVDIRLSLLMIGRAALAGVSGEVFSLIGQRLKRASKNPNTIMITHCNGSSGYLPDDAAYAQISYEIQVSRVKPGCAEKEIIRNLTQMIRSGKK